MNVEQSLRLRVVRLEHIVSDRPRGRDTARMHDLAEIALAKTEQCRAIDLRVAADVVMERRRERLSPCIRPGLPALVVTIDKDRLRAPVLLGALEVIAALQNQNMLAARCEPLGQRGASRSAADDDDVVTICKPRVSSGGKDDG